MGLKERRQREKEQRRKQILDAARSLLFEKGLHATSINQIAKLSELSVGTIYFYYKSKEEIFAVLQEEGLELLYKKVDKIAKSSKSPVNKIKSISSAYLEFSEEYKNYFDIINYFLSSPDIVFAPDLKNRIDQHGNRILSIVNDVIEGGIRKGVFRKVNVRRCSIILWGTLHGLIHFKKLKNTILQGEDIKKLFSNAVDNFINNLSVAGKV